MATVPSIADVDRLKAYTAIASQTGFAVTWPVFATDNTDAMTTLRVTVDGVEETDWTFVGTAVSGLTGVYNGGTITRPTALTGGEAIVVWSDAPPTRDSDFIEGASFPATTLDRVLSRLFANQRDDQQRREAIIRRPFNETALDMKLPAVATRASKYLGFNAVGGIALLGGSGTGALLTDLSASDGTDLIGYNQGGTGAVTRLLTSRLQDAISPYDFGANGDGSTNDGPALQLWLDELEANGGIGLFPAGVFATSQELVLRAAIDTLIIGPGTFKAQSTLWGATNRIWSILKIYDCKRTVLSDVTFEGDGSAKPSTLENSKRFVTIGSNTATEDVILNRVKYRYATSQPVVIESVERSGNATDDPITAPSTVTTSGIKLLSNIWEDSLGGFITFNGGCDDLLVDSPTYRNVSGILGKIDAEIRVGGSSVNPNSCPPSRGTRVTNVTAIDCDGSELGSSGFFSMEERVNGIVLDGITFTGCASPADTAPYFAIKPGQGSFEVDSVVISDVLIEGSTYHSIVRISGPGASDIKSVALRDFVLKSNTQSSGVGLITLENDNCDFLSLDGFEVHDQIARLISGAPATAGLVKINDVYVKDSTNDIVQLTNPGNLEIRNSDLIYAKVCIDCGSGWHGDIVIRRNNLKSTAATGTKADLEFDNAAAGSGSSWDICHNSFRGTPNTGQEKINITGQAITGSDAVNIHYNDFGDAVNVIRSVSTGLCSHNTVASISGTKFIDFVSSAKGRGGGNIMAFVHALAAPTTNFTDFQPLDAVQTLTGAGAVDLVSKITLLVTTGVNALTLADGYEGQTKEIYMKTDAGDGTLTPANLSNGTTITFDDVGDSANLRFIDGSWNMIGGTATLA